MVHRDGSALRQCARRQDPARHRARRDRATRAGRPPSRREPHQGHGRRTSPTGSCPASAPGACRWRFSSARTARSPFRRGGQRPHRRRPIEQEGADAWFARRRERAVPGRRARCRRLRQDRRPARRLVRFGLDPRLRARGRRALSRTGRHPAGDRRRPRQGDVSRRLRPASRLVPVVAARKLRHARPRAVTTSC